MNTHRYLDVYRLSIELVTGINKALKVSKTGIIWFKITNNGIGGINSFK